MLNTNSNRPNNNIILISLKYVTNFNPNFFIKPSNLNKNNIKSDKINCKNFILFILLLKYIFLKKKNNGVSVFVKPKKSRIYNILRAPYKNKMARHQLTFSRFFFNISITLLIGKPIQFNKTTNIIYFIDFIKNFYSFLESNVCFQHKSNLSFKFYLNNFFLI